MNFNHPLNHHHQIPSQNYPIYTTFNHRNPNFLTEEEQKLRDEVIYLHSLWHRGPPILTPQQQNPHLKPYPSTLFKKKKKNKKKKKTQVVSDKEWPIDTKPTSDSPPSGSGWARFKPNLTPNTRPATAEELARVSALKVQLKGLDSCVGLFKKSGSDDDDEDEDDEDEDDDEDGDEGFEFLLKVFEGDDELKGYYVKNCEDGEFYCLVCGVIGSKFGRKYKNCVALIQHCVTISKTKKKKAHRAFGHVVCKVLGWDINRLPSLPSSNGDGSDPSLAKSSEVQGEAENHADGRDDNLNAVGVGTAVAKASDIQ